MIFTDAVYLEDLNGKKYFSRRELLQSFRKGGFALSDAAFSKKVTSMVQSGDIVRVGKDVYSLPDEQIYPYKHEYSDLANELAEIIKEQYPLIDFTVFELIQLNDFVNHQLAHNVLFLSAESEVKNFIFDTLKDRYFGKVFLDPSPEIYHQYWSDNMIILTKLVTEAPMGQDVIWHTRLEKLLVDIMSDDLILESVTPSEYPMIYEDAFSRYIVDESCMFRYARRRKTDKKIKSLIQEKTDITLRTTE
ncbi:MAG: hypothetical protein LIO56_01900 [Lachnospiraceae bacterium]|nr:hypothetical protein [Lachnospiraceae bacterium]